MARQKERIFLVFTVNDKISLSLSTTILVLTVGFRHFTSVVDPDPELFVLDTDPAKMNEQIN